MALRKKAHDIPADAVVLDETEAMAYVWNVVENWTPTSDIWAIKYSVGVLGGINALTGLVINRHYRNKLKLGIYGHMSSVVPITLLPGVFTAFFHRHFVTTDILLMKMESCPVCYEVRSAAIQWGFGLVYPLILGPTSAFMFANRYNTYRVPSLTKKPMELFQFAKKISKPLSNTLIMFGFLQLFTSSVMTYYEMKNHLTINRKIQEIEAKVLNN